MNIISGKNSLHRAITPVLILAQMFALLPVQGIRGQNTSYLVWVKPCRYLLNYSIRIASRYTGRFIKHAHSHYSFIRYILDINTYITVTYAYTQSLISHYSLVITEQLPCFFFELINDFSIFYYTISNILCFFFRFNWFSWPVIYVFVVIAASLLILSFSLIKIYMTGLTYYSTGNNYVSEKNQFLNLN